MENNFEGPKPELFGPEFKDRIETEQRDLRENFLVFFTSRGYIQIEPEPLLPREDKTLIFTNATIVPFKKYIENSELPEPGLVVEQKCLRFQNLKGAFDDNYKPKYGGYFKMLGIIGVKEATASKDVIDYIKNVLGIPEVDLRVFASSDDREIFKTWYQNFQVEEDTEGQSFYNWKYGMDRVRGRGLTISVKNSFGQYQDIGNMIAIIKDEKVTGYEFGLGIETTLARKFGLPHPLVASRISEVIEFKDDPIWEKFQDFCMQAVILYSEGVRSGEGRANYIAKKIIKAILDLSKKLGLDISLVQDYLSRYAHLELGSDLNSASLKIIEDINKLKMVREKNISQYMDYLKNQIRLGKFDRDFVQKKGVENYSLSEAEASTIIGSMIKK